MKTSKRQLPFKEETPLLVPFGPFCKVFRQMIITQWYESQANTIKRGFVKGLWNVKRKKIRVLENLINLFHTGLYKHPSFWRGSHVMVVKLMPRENLVGWFVWHWPVDCRIITGWLDECKTDQTFLKLWTSEELWLLDGPTFPNLTPQPKQCLSPTVNQVEGISVISSWKHCLRPVWYYF